MIVNMLQNLNHMYSSHNNNIKYIGSTIKFIYFEPIDYTINFDVILSFMVFSNFDSIFLFMYS